MQNDALGQFCQLVYGKDYRVYRPDSSSSSSAISSSFLNSPSNRTSGSVDEVLPEAFAALHIDDKSSVPAMLFSASPFSQLPSHHISALQSVFHPQVSVQICQRQPSFH